jgi:hypothetical protein
MNNNVDPYEQMLVEDFKHNILDGRVTVADIKKLFEENKLSAAQLEVVEELAPMLGGLGNMLKAGANKVGNVAKGAVQGVKNMGQGIANTYNQGKQNAMKQNFKSALDRFLSGPLKQLTQQGVQAFPNDQVVSEGLNNITAWVQYLSKQLQGNTPIQSNQIKVNGQQQGLPGGQQSPDSGWQQNPPA